jgi:hypothetical protein
MTELMDSPKDFIRFICMRCPEKEDYFPEGCVCYATRDHTPDVCPADPQHRTCPWKIDKILCREGSCPW